MPINRGSKNRLSMFVEDIQKLSDDKYNSLTNSNLKYSRKEIRGQIEKYLRKSIKEILYGYSAKKITEITNLIIDNVFESHKNFEKVMEKECLYLGMVMPFLPNDQVRGHALEKLGFKTICGDLDKKALIERYTLNEITIPDYVRKGAKKQKVEWDDRVTVFEVEKNKNHSQPPVENPPSISSEPEPQTSREDELQKEIDSSTAKALDLLDESLAEETPENPIEAEKLNENESLISIIPESDMEADTSANSETTENGNQEKEKSKEMAQTENLLILESDRNNNSKPGENDTIMSEFDSTKAVVNFGGCTKNLQLNNPQENKENVSPSKKSSDEESGDEEGLELRREIYSKTSEDNFIFGKHYSDDEEMRSSFSLPDGNDKDMEVAEGDNMAQKKSKWIISSKVIIKDGRSGNLEEIEKLKGDLTDRTSFDFQEKGELCLEKFRSRQKLNFESLTDELQPSQSSQDETAMKKLIRN